METDGSTTILAAVAEGNAKWVTFGPLKDKDGTETAPGTAFYRIDRINSAGVMTQVLDWTSITPAITSEIMITSAQNSFTAASDAYEKRRVSYKGIYSATDTFEDWCEYDVVGNNSYP